MAAVAEPINSKTDVVYKHLASKWKKGALEKGCIRLGTISYYREIEDEARRDILEGEKQSYIGGEGKHVTLPAEQVNKYEKYLGLNLGDNIQIKMGPKSKIYSPPQFNALTFCCSVSDDIHLGDEFYSIINLSEFCLDISRILDSNLLDKLGDDVSKETHEFLGIHKCVEYVDNKGFNLLDNNDVMKVENRNGIHLSEVFEKEESFSPEKEYRFIWVPVEKSLKQGDLDFVYGSIPENPKYYDVYSHDIKKYFS
jgi:hypothetical protein